MVSIANHSSTPENKAAKDFKEQVESYKNRLNFLNSSSCHESGGWELCHLPGTLAALFHSTAPQSASEGNRTDAT